MIPLGPSNVLRRALFFFFIYESSSGEAWVNIDSSSLLEMRPLIHTGGSHRLICALRCGRRESEGLGRGLSCWWSSLWCPLNTN